MRGLTKSITSEYLKAGSDTIPNAFFYIPIEEDNGFAFREGYLTCRMEVWTDTDTMLERDNGKKSFDVITMRIFDTPKDDNTPIIGELVFIPYSVAIDYEYVNQFIADNILTLGYPEAFKVALRNSILNHFKDTCTDLAGYDMIGATPVE